MPVHQDAPRHRQGIGSLLATAMVAGFLTMYCLTIGGYLTHMVRSGQVEELQRTYPPFRRRTRLKSTYAAAMLVQLGVAVVALATARATESSKTTESS